MQRVYVTTLKVGLSEAQEVPEHTEYLDGWLSPGGTMLHLLLRELPPPDQGVEPPEDFDHPGQKLVI